MENPECSIVHGAISCLELLCAPHRDSLDLLVAQQLPAQQKPLRQEYDYEWIKYKEQGQVVFLLPI
jgi:hypothetical protein